MNEAHIDCSTDYSVVVTTKFCPCFLKERDPNNIFAINGFWSTKLRHIIAVRANRNEIVNHDLLPRAIYTKIKDIAARIVGYCCFEQLLYSFRLSRKCNQTCHEIAVADCTLANVGADNVFWEHNEIVTIDLRDALPLKPRKVYLARLLAIARVKKRRQIRRKRKISVWLTRVNNFLPVDRNINGLKRFHILIENFN